MTTDPNMILRSSLSWTPPRLEVTRSGNRYVQSAYATNAVLAKVRTNVKHWSNNGFVVTRTVHNGWVIKHFSKPPKELDVKPFKWVEPKLKVNSEGLLDYQVKSLRRVYAAQLKHKVSLDLSDGGTGKTYVAAGLVRELGLIPIIVCPKAVRIAFYRVFSDFGIPISMDQIQSWEAMRGGYKKWVSLEQDSELDWVFDHKWHVTDKHIVILDESHKAKGVVSSNSRMVAALTKTEARVHVASATLASTPAELNAVGQLFKLHQGGHNFVQWCESYGISLTSSSQLASQEAMMDIHHKLLPEYGTRIRIPDLGDKFPESQVVAEAYDAGKNTQKIKDVYDKMLDDVAREESKDSSSKFSVFKIILKARMKAEILKAPLFYDLAQDAKENGYSVAMFLNFSGTICKLIDMLKSKSVIWGKQGLRERQRVIDEFQADLTHDVICNIKAGGVAVSLHDVRGERPRMAFISPTYSAQDLAQATFRVHRAGGKSKSFQRIVFAAGTIEEKVLMRSQHKIKNISTLNDGDLALIENYL